MIRSDLTIVQLLRELTQQRAPYSDTAALDAFYLVQKITGHSRAGLILHENDMVSAAQYADLKELMPRYVSGEPMAYLLGEKAFWSFSLEVSDATLIPRPETECLIDWVLATCDDMPRRVVDLGTGSGAIALALAVERPRWEIVATDASAAALQVAKNNAAKLGISVQFVEGSWWEPVVGESFDLVVGNPPYIAENDPHLSALEFEPQSALVSGADGLDAIRTILYGLNSHMTSNAWVALEHGYNQCDEVCEVMRAVGLSDVRGHKDLSGIYRFSVGKNFK